MTDNLTQVESWPRIDTLATDATTDAQYTGAVWFGGRPQLSGFRSIASVHHLGPSPRSIASMRGARIGSPFFLPDSLPCRADVAASASPLGA